jgi:hypothetical protein
MDGSFSNKQRGEIRFETGYMTKEDLEALLNTLPIDITFVDKEDTVRYFSQPKHRLFPKAKAVIGRKCSNAILKKASIW